MKHIILSSLLAAGVASAATVQVDLGITTTGNTTTATGWNNAGATAGGGDLFSPIADLVDSTGASTGIGLSAAKIGTAGTSGTGANYTGSYPAALASLPATALRDGLFFAQSGGTITFTLTGLNPSLTYDFLLYGARGNNGSVDTTFQVNGAGTGAVTNVGPVLNNDDDYADIQGVSPTAGGVITVVATSIGGASNNGGAINMMSFTAVPEPTSLALLGLASLGMLRRRR